MTLNSRNKAHIILVTKVIDELNKLENQEYQKEIADFLSPVLFIKQKFKPIIGSYRKVKMNALGLWTPEADLKFDYLAKEIPPDIKFSINLLITKTSLLSNSKSLKEDIAALQVSRSEKVNAKVPREIVGGFLQAHQCLRVLNRTIQVPGGKCL